MKWFRQATAILRDYMKGGTSIRARTIRSYLLGTRQRIPERRTLQTTLANRPTDLTEAIDRLPPGNVPDYTPIRVPPSGSHVYTDTQAPVLVEVLIHQHVVR